MKTQMAQMGKRLAPQHKRLAAKRSGARGVGGLVLCVCALLAGCASPPRTTRMTIADFQDMAVAMAQSLARSPSLTRRGPQSPKWIISLDKVTNLSSDVMTVPEEWAIVEKLVDAAPMRTLGVTKNIVFVLPPERVTQLRQDLAAREEPVPDLGSKRQVTHEMTATFRSAVRADLTNRSDLYYCQFQLIDLRGNQPVWSDKFEFKRIAAGNLRD